MKERFKYIHDGAVVVTSLDERDVTATSKLILDTVLSKKIKIQINLDTQYMQQSRSTIAVWGNDIWENIINVSPKFEVESQDVTAIEEYLLDIYIRFMEV